jgi:uncharacterized oxidoreductase
MIVPEFIRVTFFRFRDLNFANSGLIFVNEGRVFLRIFDHQLKKANMNLANNKILITGGASGIGLGLTERFLQEGNTVIVCGRRASVLQEVAEKHPTVITKVSDIATEAGRNELYQWVAEIHSDLNVLVNNAGIQNWMKITDDDFFARAKEEIATNIEAPLHLISLFLKLPSLNTVMNVTSGLAFVPFTNVPVYSATKAFFHSFTLSARHLLKANNVEVIEVIPPALNTDLGGIGLHDAHPPVSAFIESIFEQLKAGNTELTFGFSQAMANGSPEEIKGIFNRLNGN